MNQAKTFFLMVVLTIIFVGLGSMIGGKNGAVLAFGIALIMNLISYWFSDRIVLAMYGAKEVSEGQAPELYGIVASLSQRAGIPMPRVFMIESDSPNAFATGRNPEHGVVAVTAGIMRILDRQELEGVLAHELSHVKHRDILISTVAASLAGAITMLANWARWTAFIGGGRDSEEGGGNIVSVIIFSMLAAFAAMLIQLAISRSREYLADEGGAKLSGNPLFLANALRRLQAGVAYTPMENANPSTAHMFIVNPFSARGGVLALFSTHPPMEERIKRLEEMAYKR
jgi:heat shock protein HtpX